MNAPDAPGYGESKSYIVLARKLRPAQFSDIVGQAPVVRTLMNAIRSERIHQAYLFTGTRGIGKTSIARIFAKAVRCEQTSTDDQWLRSCDSCSSCLESIKGTSVDVIEIDGASNNGVDAVREIRENAKYLPSTGKRKIYIIDEVHMLTTAAFNALLKTLEEPPAHVIFIFATTEPHKIPATILSRCQRFDFRRVTVAQIQARLLDVVKSEGIEADSAALALIARAADGSMRDSLSLLDQVIAFAGKRITATAVRESIGLIEGQTVISILQSVVKREPIAALGVVQQAYDQGHDLRVLTRTLLEFLHAAILAKIGASQPSGLELSDEEWSEIREISSHRELEELEMIFQAIHHGMDWIARSPQPKTVLDVVLIKCATAEALIRIDGTGSTGAAPSTLTGAGTFRHQNSAPTPQESKPVVRGDQSWEALIAFVKKDRPLLASILEHGSCKQLPTESGILEIHFSKDGAYFREQLQSKVYSEQLASHAREFFSRHVRVKLELSEGAEESLAAKKERLAREREEHARLAAQTHPMITEARALFGGELGPIELPSGVGEQE